MKNYTVTVTGTTHLAALDASEFENDHGVSAPREVVRGRGRSMVYTLTGAQALALAGHLATLADMLSGDPDGARDVRAIRRDLSKMASVLDDVRDDMANASPVCANDGEPVEREGRICDDCADALRESDALTRSALRGETVETLDVLAGAIREGDRLADSTGRPATVTHTRNVGDCADGTHYVSAMFSRGTDAQRTARRFHSLDTVRVERERGERVAPVASATPATPALVDGPAVRGAARDALRKIANYREANGRDPLDADGERETLAVIARHYGWTRGEGDSEQFGVWSREGDTVTVRFSLRPGAPVTGAVYATPTEFGAQVDGATIRRCDVVASWLTAPIVRVVAMRDADAPTTDESAAMAHTNVGSFRTFGEARDALTANMRREAQRLTDNYPVLGWSRKRAAAMIAGADTLDALAWDPLDGETSGPDAHVITESLRWTLRALTRDPGAALDYRPAR